MIFWVWLELSAERKRMRKKIIGILENINTRGMILGPEKYSALARIYMALKEYDHALTAIRNPDAKVTGLVRILTTRPSRKYPNFISYRKVFTKPET